MALAGSAPLATTLVVSLSAAFIGGLTAAKLRLSPIVGYLLAGVILGPLTPEFIVDSDVTTQIAEIGIVLLMFGVGLHFSLKDLLEVKGIAIPGALGQIAVAMALGTAVTYYWGWPLKGGLLFGLALSVASTVVLLRTLEEHNLLHTNNGHIAIGWLIVEDLIIVLTLVLLPTLALKVDDITSANMKDVLVALARALGELAAFIACMFFIGKRLLPWMLGFAASTRSRELFTLAVFVVAVGVAFGTASLFNISLALGAFFAGMTIKESELSSEVSEKFLPFQDAFAVLFFVSVGMLFNPEILFQHPIQVITVILIITIGKSVAAFIIVLLCRYPLRTALLISASLAQIGEFSFILGALGVSYGLFSEAAKDMILAGALASIAINPLLFYAAEAFHHYTMKHKNWKDLQQPSEDELGLLTRQAKKSLQDPVILIGFGHIGQYLQEQMQLAEVDHVIIDYSRERVEELRGRGVMAIAGDAAFADTLKDAGILKARAIMVTVSNAYRARSIITMAREIKPEIEVIVQAHNEEELTYYREQHVNLAVLDSQEVAKRMLAFITD
jgi:CPA2 family monovalent cation:H+ antiporter-2